MSITLTKPKAFIFDWDNTLVDTWPTIHDALAKTFSAMGREVWAMEQVKERVRKSMRDSFPEIFGDNWQEAADIYQSNYRAIHLERLSALPNALSVVEKVKDMRLYSVVVSNKKGDNLRKEVEHIGWNHLFDKVVGATDAKRDKPFVDPVELALSDSGIAPGSDVWFVGDSEIDLECALNTGCTAILYGDDAAAHPEYSATHYRGSPYHAHAENHDKILKIISRFT